jgi:hypothetical protein
VHYRTEGAAGETSKPGTPLFDYRFALPTAFRAQAGVRYWVQIEAEQSYPDWGFASAAGGPADHHYFRYLTGAHMFQSISGDLSFSLEGNWLCKADLGGQGGVPGPDGVLNNNDFVVFIDYFFTQDARADVGSQGGVAGFDGQFNNNDFIVFIDLFFAGC